MQEVARGARVPLDAVFRNSADELVDPVTPLVDILDPANDVIVTDTAPVRSSLGLYDYPDDGYLVPDDAAFGVWTARWTGTVDGDVNEALDEFEVVAALTPSDSDHYFTVAEGRATDATFADIEDDLIAQVRGEVEDEIERATGVAVIPRTATTTIDGPCRSNLVLPHMYVRSVTAVRVFSDAANYVDFTGPELADIVVADTGVIHRSTLGYWAGGFANVRVTYTHGMDAPPAAVKRAALLLFRYRLANATWRIPSTPTAVDAEGNPTAEGLAIAQTNGTDDRESPTGIPVVDDLLRPWLGQMVVVA